MPYEVSMSGGSPWGFRLSGGPLCGRPVAVSRVTPGGKAAQANVMQGDVLVAINSQSISDIDLPEIMEKVKLSGATLHMTLLSQEEIEQTLNKKRHSEANFTSVTEMERPRSQLVLTPVSERPSSQMRSLGNGSIKATSTRKHFPDEMNLALSNGVSNSDLAHLESNGIQNVSNHMPKITIKVGRKNRKKARDNGVFESGHDPEQAHDFTPAEDKAAPPRSPSPMLSCARSPSPQQPVVCSSPKPPPPAPKPRTSKLAMSEPNGEEADESQDNDQEESKEMKKKKLPDYIKRQMKPAKPAPDFKPQVQWLHDKLRLKGKPSSGITNPGNTLKVAAAAYPCQRIEIEGPVSATIVHAQYNTPVGMYSANQIVNTLVNTAAARGADVPDPTAFGDQNVPVDKSTAVYKLVHKQDRSSPAPAQSRSIQILDALLDYDEDALQHF